MFARFRKRSTIAILILILTCGLVTTAATARYSGSPQAAQATGGPQVESQLTDQFATSGSAGYLIYFNSSVDLSSASSMSWIDRGRFVYETLQQAAELAQGRVREYLDSHNVEYQAFWVENVISVKSSSKQVFDGLLSFHEIQSMKAHRVLGLIEPDVVEPADDNTIETVGTNIARVKADQVWALGYSGQNIVVANIDTGVRYTHTALVGKYRGNNGDGTYTNDYNWYDPYGDHPDAPGDDNGHGSHTMGTMVGDDGGTNQIGMAPGATWIACRGCDTNSCGDAELLACAQFMVAPTTLTGADPNPDVRPYVVNNSWGDCGLAYDSWYQGAIDAWQAAGIYPVFSNGNASNCSYSSPPGLNTVGNPARSGNVTGVGATSNSTGTYATFSNWGPTDNADTVNPRGFPYLKPQIAAPGSSIKSSYRTSDTTYSNMSGTSMSAPHVVGLVALLWSAAPNLIGDYATTETIIEETATRIPYASGGSPSPGQGNVPNYATGWGEINALAAVQMALATNTSGTLHGAITDASTGNPIPAKAVLTSSTYTLTDAGNDAGTFTRRLPVGAYTFTASLYGYHPDTTNFTISLNRSTSHSLALTPTPFYTVSGRVLDSVSGWPIYARIDIAGVNDLFNTTVWTDPQTGAYSVSLAGDVNAYTFNVSAFISGFGTATATVGPLTADTTTDFTLAANTTTCSAPGYGFTAYTSENFEASDGGYTHSGTNDSFQWGTPVTWPSACVSGTKCWGTNLSGNYATSANMTLISPVIDLTSVAPGAALTARWQQANYIRTFTSHQGYAEVSINGGAWTIMWQNPSSSTQETWRALSYDISSAAGGTVQFRWRLVSNTSSGYAGLYVDDVTIVDALKGCHPGDGGLVFGNVFDANTGSALNGALVTREDGFFFKTLATPSDSKVSDGFYLLFSPAGSHAFTASNTGGYANKAETVDIVANEVTKQNFSLAAGVLSVAPTSLDVTMIQGQPATADMTVNNIGTAPATFTMKDLVINENFEGAFPPAGWSVVDPSGNCSWTRNDAVESPNYAGGDGYSAAADSDFCGAGTTMNTQLITPTLDFRRVTSASLSFMASYFYYSGTSFKVDVSTDGGATWTNHLSWSTTSHSNYGPGELVTIDLSAYAGQPTVNVRFYYQSNDYTWWAQVDQVRIAIDALVFSPATGTMPEQTSQPVQVTFKPEDFAAVGDYTRTIKVENGTPYGSLYVPATVHVVAAERGVTAEVDKAAKKGRLGTDVVYTFTITNTGNAPDTFDLSVSGNVWNSVLSAASVTLGVGESTTVTVTVTVPADAANAATDAVTLTAVSQGDATATASAEATTTCEFFKISFPLIFMP